MTLNNISFSPLAPIYKCNDIERSTMHPIFLPVTHEIRTCRPFGRTLLQSSRSNSRISPAGAANLVWAVSPLTRICGECPVPLPAASNAINHPSGFSSWPVISARSPSAGKYTFSSATHIPMKVARMARIAQELDWRKGKGKTY